MSSSSSASRIIARSRSSEPKVNVSSRYGLTATPARDAGARRLGLTASWYAAARRQRRDDGQLRPLAQLVHRAELGAPASASAYSRYACTSSAWPAPARRPTRARGGARTPSTARARPAEAGSRPSAPRPGNARVGGGPAVVIDVAGPVREAAFGGLEALQPLEAALDVRLDARLLLLREVQQLRRDRAAGTPRTPSARGSRAGTAAGTRARGRGRAAGSARPRAWPRWCPPGPQRERGAPSLAGLQDRARDVGCAQRLRPHVQLDALLARSVPASARSTTLATPSVGFTPSRKRHQLVADGP
jgi:hypothetical protein